jgi:hypothetical protein
MSEAIRRVKTATEFQAAVDAGDLVELEIAYAYVLRSDMPPPAEFLKKRLENMLEEERFWAQQGFATPRPHCSTLGASAWPRRNKPGCNRAKAKFH